MDSNFVHPFLFLDNLLLMFGSKIFIQTRRHVLANRVLFGLFCFAMSSQIFAIIFVLRGLRTSLKVSSFCVVLMNFTNQILFRNKTSQLRLNLKLISRFLDDSAIKRIRRFDSVLGIVSAFVIVSFSLGLFAAGYFFDDQNVSTTKWRMFQAMSNVLFATHFVGLLTVTMSTYTMVATIYGKSADFLIAQLRLVRSSDCPITGVTELRKYFRQYILLKPEANKLLRQFPIFWFSLAFLFLTGNHNQWLLMNASQNDVAISLQE